MIPRRLIILAITLLMAQLCHADAPLRWLDSLDSAYLQSQSDRREILVFVGQDSAAASRQQWQTLTSPQLTDALGPLTLVHLDPEKSQAAMRSLGILSLPALRRISADGKIISSADGVMSAADLTAWLAKEPKPAEAESALEQLGASDTAVREAAIRQIRSDPTMAGKVVELLTASSLQQRLSATDLLDQWGAPVGHLDPWTTVSADDLATLRKWATSAKPQAATQPVVTDELDALIAASTEIDARAVRERLVRYAQTILPQVADRLKAHPDDPARERLVALRYRLVATDRLAAAWPGGFDRLASADSAIRRSAVSELSTIANADDHRLLRELFTDNDPFVREQSLKLLRTVGGAETDKALVELLNDSEPNVRAAVLKTLVDSPDEALADDLMQYVQREKDTDLLVHAVHVLQATPGDKTLDCMLGLLNHPQWRVRGEVAEGLLARLSPQEGNAPTPEQTAKMHAALIKCLDDQDGYVVAKAAFSLIKSDFPASVTPLMNAAQKRPELALDVLHAIGNDPTAATSVVGQILTMTHSSSPAVRSAAIMALATTAPQSSGEVIHAALHDPDPAVRGVAVRAIESALNQLLPVSGFVTRTSFFGLSTTQEPVDLGQWVADFRAGKDRPKWVNDVAPDLEKALTQKDCAVSAAVALCALGKDQDAWPVLTAAAADPSQDIDAAVALTWLPWDRRVELFQKLMHSAQSGNAPVIMTAFATIPDARAAGPLWEMLNPPNGLANLESVHDALRKLYLGDQYYNVSALSDDRKQTVITAAKEKAANGSELQRTVALSLLLTTSPTDAAAAAKGIYRDHKNSEWARLDSLQVLLMALPKDDATQVAVGAISEAPMRKVAIPYLAAGVEPIQQVRGQIELYTSVSYESYTQGQPIVVTPPAGLTKEVAAAAMAQATADHSDDLTADAGYLLATLGDRSGLDMLLRTARGHDWQEQWSRMAYRAIAKINDDSMTPVLEEIYRRLAQVNKYEIREMYWTIQTMTGPNIVKLRQTILNELGTAGLQ